MDVGTLELIVRRKGELPPMPSALTQLLRAIDQGETSVRELERILASDPALVAHLFRITGGSNPTPTSTSLRHLIMRLGFRSFRSVAVSALVRLTMFSSMKCGDLPREKLCKASLATSTLAKHLYIRKQGLRNSGCPLDAEEVFAISLLANIGPILIATISPELVTRLLALCATHQMGFEQAYLRVFGKPLTQLAGLATETWQLPNVFSKLLFTLHEPWKAGELAPAALTIQHGRRIAHDLGYRLEEWECNLEVPLEVEMEEPLTDEELQPILQLIEQLTSPGLAAA